MNEFYSILKEYIDEKYKKFNAKLSPNLNPDYMLGIRIPILRKIAKQLSDDLKKKLLNDLPHQYYEEILLHRFVIENMPDYDQTIIELNKLLPYLNNWSLTDGFSNKTFKKNKQALYKQILIWLKDANNYIKRFAIGLLMNYFLDDDFKEEHLHLVCEIKAQNDYYLEMMIAWYLATALAKQYDVTIKYFLIAPINDSTFNKTISKCLDSLRITPEQKLYLKTLRKKQKSH